MSIIDKIGQRPDNVMEHDNGDITYVFWKYEFRYAVDGVYVKLNNGDEKPISNGLECRVNEDDSIEHFEWAKSWAMIAREGDEPLYELGRHLVDVGGEMTPSGWGYNPEKTEGMKIWFEIPEVWVYFQMEADGLIKMEDCFTGDEYVSNSVDGALERLAWLIERTEDHDLWEAIQKGKDKMQERYSDPIASDEEEE